MTARTRIVARLNPVGVGRDVRILTEAIGGGRKPIAVSGHRSIPPWRRFVGRRDPKETLVFLERVAARWLRHAGRTLLIPNQERYPRRLVPRLRHVDHVLCKSRHASEIFGRVHGSVHLVGFTSLDRAIPDVAPDYERFLHVAGGSAVKGTDVLLEVWRRHPEWPVLTVVHHRKGAAPSSVPANVDFIDRYLPDHALRELQNRCGLHLCPSSSEGWGHYIVEALSCGAVTVVTDGPPMNELVQPGRGVTVPWSRRAPRKLGTDYYVDPDALEAAIIRLLDEPEADKAARGAAARAWFEENDAGFRRRIRDVWERVGAG